MAEYVFGYGSLIWKADFPYESKTVGYVKGFCRRFWQHSEDHRGAPGSPGRVVMIAKTSNMEDKVWGVAYKIPADQRDSTQKHLNQRETGYIMQTTIFYPRDLTKPPFELGVYIATPNNPFYAGPAPLESMAMQIYTSKGLSGSNLEYFMRLVEAMRAIAPGEDQHLVHLESQIRLIRDREASRSLNSTVSSPPSSRDMSDITNVESACGRHQKENCSDLDHEKNAVNSSETTAHSFSNHNVEDKPIGSGIMQRSSLTLTQLRAFGFSSPSANDLHSKSSQ